MGEGSLSQEDIDALLGGFSGGAAPAGGGSGGGLDDLDALVGGGGGGGGDEGPSFADIAAALGPSSTPTPAKNSSKSQSGGGGGNNTANLNLLLDVTLQLTIELGRTTMFIKDVLQLTEGTVVELDKNVGEELDILANGKLVGRGKLIVLDDYYGIQITQIVNPMERLGGAPAFM